MRFWDKAVCGLALGLAGYWTIRHLVRRSRWFDFAGKVVLVTGGSRGLGLVTARQLVEQGARVAILARTAADVAAATAELSKRGSSALDGSPTLGIVCDVRDRQQVAAAVDRVLAQWGRIDVLLNVAGIIQVGPLDAMTLDDFHDAMDTNCWGALHTVLATLPTMRRQGFGRIVNVASLGGKRAVPHMLPYDTSKFALVGLSTGLRTELAKDGILVTTACPSLMRTGSPRNATFKGEHRLEYAWFAIGDALPIISLSAERAASQILRACQNGDGEVYIANAWNVTTLAAQLFPALTTEILTLVNRWLPPMGGIGRSEARGYESESILAPSVLTYLGDQAAVRNNEMRPRPGG